MEKILYFDCFSGISGDMALGALLDLGLDPAKVRNELATLGVGGYELITARTQKFGIEGMDADVVLQTAESRHSHEHERNFEQIREIIESSAISKRAKEMATGIFFEIAKAEAAVHGKDISEIHFHEVGAVDSIVDIVGVSVCLDMLGADRICCSKVREGSGFVECRHGRLPVPVPAVAKMMEGSDIVLAIGDAKGELVTPTGFGILKAMAEGSDAMPAMKIERVGYGFGKRDTGSLNALRVFMGRAETADDRVSVIEANIDDMTGEMLGHAMERFFAAGALDVYFAPVQMKKNRPAVTMTVLCAIKDTEDMTKLFFRETSTLGVRTTETARMVMERSLKTIETEFGPIRFKIAFYGDIRKSSPEYEDCAAAARKSGLPIREIYRRLKDFIE